MKTKHISISSGTSIIQGDFMLSQNNTNVLCMHGGGLRGRVGFNTIRAKLVDIGIGSYAFDYIGHGETGGELLNSSLKNKVEQTLLMIDSQNIQEPHTLIASSMGSYVAIKVTELCNIENLILIAPAVYSKDAYSTPFGVGFSEIIRKENSWQNTDAWEVLSKYTGNLLIFKAENDQIIPEGVVENIYDSAIHAKERKIITVPKATHPLTTWVDRHPNDLDIIINKIVELLN